MFGFNKSNKASKRWSLDDYELNDTTTNKSYPFNKLFAAFSEQHEQMTLWFNNQFLVTLSCEKRVFESILSRGVRPCLDFIEPYKTAEFSNGKGSILFSGAHLVINNDVFELSQITLSDGEEGQLLISDSTGQLATIGAEKKVEFTEVYRCAHANLQKTMTGEALDLYETEAQKERDELKRKQDEKDKALKFNQAEKAGFPDIILTTESISPFKVKQRLGIVSAEYAHRSKIFQQFMAEISSIGQRRVGATQTALKQAKETVLLELKREAYLLGADAIVAVDLDYSEISGAGDPMLFLVANGTAITIDHD